MSFKINTGSGFSSYQLQRNQADLSSSLERLSSGKRINRSSDDAAGMVIANTLTSQSRGFGQAVRNANDAISITQLADGALGQATGLIQDIRVRAIQSASAAQSPQSRLAIQAEIGNSLESLKDIAQNTSFNGQKLLSGAFTDKQFQVGASAGETIDLSMGSIDPSQISDGTLGALADIDVTTQAGSQAAIELTDIALNYISQQRSQVGSSQNQLESTINTLSTAQINTLSAKSTIMDLDYAEESMNLNRINLLSKAKTFAHAQANTTASKILDILG